ncbi:MAG: ABC transporter ATP-binding protein [Candidatus Omnitrophica bacterium]|nr:ABC transporter ATP-binding protein [Candidatus Omnitrophota bacterium]
MMLLEIENLTVEFETRTQRVRAVDGVSLTIEPGRTVGLVGESGSGKTTLGLAITRLLPMPPAAVRSGAIRVLGRELLSLPESELRRVRGGVVSYVFQEPSTSLNPVMTIGAQLVEALELHTPLRGSRARERAVEWLARVGIPAPAERLASYPHELSGGMKQRVMIAMAVACGPRLLVADEPTTALDVTLERQIVVLLNGLQAELGLSLLVISHSIPLVRQLAQDVAVMWRGKIVERGSTEAIIARARHEYTQRLIAAVPKVPGFSGTAA